MVREGEADYTVGRSQEADPDSAAQRRERGSISDGHAFAEAWEEIGAKVYRALRRRGVDESTALDAVQETAVRALGRIAAGAGFDSARGLLRWCHRVASNHVTDEWRTRTRRIDPALSVDVLGEQSDVPVEVEWRLLLEKAVAAMGDLSADERAALTAFLDGTFPEDKRSRDRESLRRFRARERLRRVIGELPVGFPWKRLRGLLGLGEKGLTFATGSFLVVTTALFSATPNLESRAEASRVETTWMQSIPVVSWGPVEPPRVEHHRHEGVRSQSVPSGVDNHIEVSPARETPALVVPTSPGQQIEAGTATNASDRSLVCVESELTPTVCIDQPVDRPRRRDG